MTLDQSFKYADRVAKRDTVRNVASPEGAKMYGLPIGAPITADAIARAKKKFGAAKVEADLKQRGQRDQVPDLFNMDPPRNNYDRKFDKFLAAINQANNARDRKRVDAILDKEERSGFLIRADQKDLRAIHEARKKGEPIPEPKGRGNNRAARNWKPGGEAKKPAVRDAMNQNDQDRARNYEEMHGKKPPAKKAAAKKPSPSVQAAGERAREGAAADVAAGKRPAKKAAPPPKKRTDHGELRGEDGKPILPPKPKKKPAPKAVSAGEKSVINEREKVVRDLEAAIDRADKEELQQAERQIIAAHKAKQIGDATYTRLENRIRQRRNRASVANPGAKDILQGLMDMGRKMGLKQRNLSSLAGAKQPKSGPVQPGPDQGKRTGFWMKKVQERISAARNFRELVEQQKQVNNLRKQGRISETQKSALNKKIRARLDELGLDQNGRPKQDQKAVPGGGGTGSRLRRLKERAQAAGVQPKTPPENLLDDSASAPKPLGLAQSNGPETEMYEALARAKSEASVAAVEQRARIAARNNKLEQRRVDGILREAARVRQEIVAAQVRQTKPDKPVAPNPKQARIAQWKARINAANKITDIDNLASELEGDKGLSDDEFNEIADALNAKADQLDGGAGYALRVLEAQKEYFANDKASIADAPTEGLLDYIKSDTARFSVKVQKDKKGVSTIEIIEDKKTGQRWFAKHSVFENDFGKEVLAGGVLQQLGLSKHRTRISTGAPGETPVLITQDAIQGNEEPGRLERVCDMRTDKIAKMVEEVLKGLRQGDPQGLVDMALFDYLIDNTADRHAANAFLRDDGNGNLKVMFIDHGLAFGGARSERRPQEIRPDLNFYEWFQRHYRANGQGGWSIADLISKSVDGRDDLGRRLEDAIRRLEKMDFDQLRAEYEDNVNGNQEALKNIDRYMELMMVRLEHLRDQKNLAGMVRVIAMAGGI